MTWKDKRDHICYSILAISNFYGGDDVDWLKMYCREVVNQYRENIDVAYQSFKLVAESLGIVVSFGKKPLVDTKVCTVCGYVPPFCYGKCG